MEKRSEPIEDKVRAGILYDYYGELLSESKKIIFEDYMFNDLSLSEIAEDQGVTRQAVHDSIKRTIKALEDYDAKLGLIKKTLDISERVQMITEKIDALETKNEAIDEIRSLVEGFLE